MTNGILGAGGLGRHDTSDGSRVRTWHSLNGIRGNLTGVRAIECFADNSRQITLAKRLLEEAAPQRHETLFPALDF